MKRIFALIILGALLLAPQQTATAAPVAGSSDWPSLGADAAQSNYNANEKTIKTANVLKLKVRWTTAIADQSYPIVAAGHVYVPVVYKGRIHVRVLNATNGSKLAVISKDGLGGLLYVNQSLYLAGKSLQAVDASGAVTAKITGSSTAAGTTFAFPEYDGKVIFSGYASAKSTVIYTVDPEANQTIHKLSSSSAVGAFWGSRIATNSRTGSVFYQENSGKVVARPPYIGSYWFADGPLAYSVASVNRKPVRVYAVDGTGHRSWSRVVGPAIATQGSEWAHACSPTAIYVSTLRPQIGVQALDALTGRVIWTRSIDNVQTMALANNVLFVLTYGLGSAVRLVALNATSGKVLGAIVLSAGFFTFGSLNQLMVAGGMVFIRATGPGGDELVALGLPKS